MSRYPYSDTEDEGFAMHYLSLCAGCGLPVVLAALGIAKLIGWLLS